MRYLILISLLFYSSAWAVPATLNWDWPTLYCDGTAIDQNNWIRAEVIYSLSPLPMPSDDLGDCADPPDPDGPPEATSIPITTPVTSIDIEVELNVTYYARIRVCYDTASNCSSWGGEKVFSISGTIPNPPILLEF